MHSYGCMLLKMDSMLVEPCTACAVKQIIVLGMQQETQFTFEQAGAIPSLLQAKKQASKRGAEVVLIENNATQPMELP